MSVASHDQKRLPDLLSLSACDDMATLIEALDDPLLTDQPPGPVPAHANQLGGIIVQEAVRLLRLGSNDEIVHAVSLLERYMTANEADFLAASKPEAYRQVSSAYTILQASASLQSGGSAIMVLASWGDPAYRLLNEIKSAEDERLAIDQIKSVSSELIPTQLKNLLEDLRAAALIGIAEQCSPPLLLLGPAARDEQIMALIEGATD